MDKTFRIKASRPLILFTRELAQSTNGTWGINTTNPGSEKPLWWSLETLREGLVSQAIFFELVANDVALETLDLLIQLGEENN